MYNVFVNIISEWKCANMNQQRVCVCTPGVLTNSCFNYPSFFILDIKPTCLNEEYVSGY